jgi:peroxiredoxin Q/BCP
VYFYPKDDTPGCTTEASNLRDNIFAFKAIGAEVTGTSVEDVDSHNEFSTKYIIPFVILADTGGPPSAASPEWPCMSINPGRASCLS